MGIGVSYTGYDGATRHKVVESAAELPRFMGAQTPRVGDTFRTRRPDSPALPGVVQSDPVDGPLIGIEGNDSPEPDGQVRVVGSRGGWRFPVTRTEEKIEPSIIMGCNKVTHTKLQYDVIVSESGLVKGRTVERKVWEKSFFVLAEGGTTGGKYEVRPLWTTLPGDDTPRLAGLLFGEGKNLEGDDIEEVKSRDGVTEVKVFTHGELT